MIKNNNLEVIKMLSSRKRIHTRQRSRMLIISIVLTALMITSTLTVLSTMVQSYNYSTMRQVGTIAHGGFKNLTNEQYQNLIKHSDIKKSGFTQIIGRIDDQAFKDRIQEIFYMDAGALEMSFIKPLLKGKVPEKSDDLLVSTNTLDILGLPYEIDQKISIDIKIDEEILHYNWNVCGIYEGSELTRTDVLVVSKRLASQILENHTSKNINLNRAGLIQLSVLLSNHHNAIEKLHKIAEETSVSLKEEQYAYNWAYDSGYKGNINDYITFFILILLLVTSGFLVINNIFQIGILQDIQFYGQLKVLGATKKQVRQLVLKQALALGLLGIPIGIGLGYGVGLLIIPYVKEVLSMEVGSFTIDPWIFLGACILSAMTIWFSAIKPAVIASKISPIEALRTTGIKKNHKNHSKKVKKRTNTSIYRMALSNILLYKKKAVLVMLSISFSLILLLGVTNVVGAVDSDRMIHHMIAGDYQLADSNYFIFQYDVSRAIPQKLIEDMEEETIFTLGKIYATYLKMDAYEGLASEVTPDVESQYYSDQLIKQGFQSVDAYGLNDQMMVFLDDYILEGEIDQEKFRNGEYVVLRKEIIRFNDNGHHENYGHLMHVGDSITIYDKNNQEHVYEVMALVDQLPVYLYDGNYGNLSVDAYMSEENFSELEPSKPLMIMTVFEDADDSIMSESTISDKIKGYPNIGVKSKRDYKEDYQEFDQLIKIIGYGLSFLLGLIAFINYLNTSFTSVYHRRRELAVLQSIGMTSRQMLGMLIGESLILTSFALVISTVIGGFISRQLINSVMFSKGEITFLPILIIAPLLLISLSLVPILAYNSLKKRSLIERVRFSE